MGGGGVEGVRRGGGGVLNRVYAYWWMILIMHTYLSSCRWRCVEGLVFWQSRKTGVAKEIAKGWLRDC